MVFVFLCELCFDVIIVFFYYIYFLLVDVFNVLFWCKEIVGSLLQCDFVGFYIFCQVENFVDVVCGVILVKVFECMSCVLCFLIYGCVVGLEEMVIEIQVNDCVVWLGVYLVGLDMNWVKMVLDDLGIKVKMV